MKERDFQDRLVEKCAIFGVYTTNQKASELVYAGLWALQHRGQDSSGISSSDGRQIITHKALGLVASVYQEGDLDKLNGHIAIGHNRYATSGEIEGHIQPITSDNLVALAHNGTLPIRLELTNFLQSKDIPASQLNDSELMHAALEYYVAKGKPIEEAVILSYPLFTGAFSVVILTKDKLIGLRDNHGIRPFCIGQLSDEGFVLSSETCGLDSVGAKYLRDVKPEEMVVVDRVVVIEDSIVRGTTLKNLVNIMRVAGAKELHLRIASPPVKYPDFYGIATPEQRELIASQMSVDQIRAFFGADSLQYLSYEGLITSTGLPESSFCTACYTGDYPIDIGDNAKYVIK